MEDFDQYKEVLEYGTIQRTEIISLLKDIKGLLEVKPSDEMDFIMPNPMSIVTISNPPEGAFICKDTT